MISEKISRNYPQLVPLIESGHDSIDLTNEQQSHELEETVNEILDLGLTVQDLDIIEEYLIPNADSSLTFFLLALKIVRSKLYVSEISHVVHVTVVFAVYKENIRIQKSSEHPHGEDFLRRKVSQLGWLFRDNPTINWDLLIVDDGCPENTGQIARSIIESENWRNVNVLYLQEAIDQSLPPAHHLSSTRDSQKGGSIEYGIWEAARQQRDNHIIVYTDADLSTHLGQTGLLLDPLLNENKSVAIGSRRELKSVVLKQGSRNSRGKLFIYLWKRLLPTLNDIIDTQCGFKAWKAETIHEIVDNLLEQKFAFDIELLLKAELLASNSIARVAIAWIDSEAASTTTDIQPYLPMLQAIVKMYRTYLPLNPESEPYAALIDGLSQEQFEVLLENIPAGIINREPIDFGEYKGVTAEEMADAIN